MKIAVTGASGYIATWIIKDLLNNGHTVKGVVRDLSNKEKYEFLYKHAKEGQLEFFEADINNQGAYTKIFEGCDAVIHTATPYFYQSNDPQKDIVDPAVNGTKHAMESALAAKVKRIVVTSSGGAVFHFPVPEGYVFTDKDWNSNTSITLNAYFHSKRLAEETAWNFYKEHPELELVVVNPLFVLGPCLSKVLNTSLKLLFGYLNGQNKTIQQGFVGTVDVRDVSSCHVIAVENPDAAGKRLLCCNQVVSWKAIPDKLVELFPQYPTIRDSTDQSSTKAPYSIDTTPAQNLGWKPVHSFNDMIKESVEAFINHGIIS